MRRSRSGAMLPQNEGGRAMRVEQSAIIRRPPDEVFTFLENRANDTAWMTSVIQSEWLDSGGKPCRTTGPDGHQDPRPTTKFLDEVTDYVPGRRIAHRTVEGPFPLKTACICEPARTWMSSPPSSASSIEFRAAGSAGWRRHLSDASSSTDSRPISRGSRHCSSPIDDGEASAAGVMCQRRGSSEISTTQGRQHLSCAAIATRGRFRRRRC